MKNNSEILFGEQGRIYHLGFAKEQLADVILTVGDPQRVPMVSAFLERIDFNSNHREFVAHRGVRKGKHYLVLSTGMGTDNIEILLNELYILSAIDPDTLEPRPSKQELKVIRLGTSGSISSLVKAGDILVSSAAIGFDQLDRFYELQEASWKMQNTMVKEHYKNKLGLHSYYCQANAELLELFGKSFMTGLTLTMPGFYSPQGRSIPGVYNSSHLIEHFKSLSIVGHSPVNMEMETAGYYQIGAFLGIQCLSVNAIMASRLDNKFYQQPERLLNEMITRTFELIDQM